jgi:hypothetical protein
MTVPRCVVSGDRGSLIGVSRRRGRYLACMAAKSGPVYVRPDGTATCREAWPQVADLSRRPAFPSGAVYARPDLNDIISEWREKRGAQNDDLAQALIEWSTRVLEQTAENERAGVEKYSERCERAWDSIHDVENALQAHAGESFFALATVLVIESENGEDGRSEAAPSHPAPIRPQLVGPIAEDADRMLAETPGATRPDRRLRGASEEAAYGSPFYYASNRSAQAVTASLRLHTLHRPAYGNRPYHTCCRSIRCSTFERALPL